MFAKKCSNCGRSAFEDCYFKTDETFIKCYRCGYVYTRKLVKWTETSMEFEENEYLGYGVMKLAKKDKSSKITFLNYELSEVEIENYKNDFLNEDIDLTKSFFCYFQT